MLGLVAILLIPELPMRGRAAPEPVAEPGEGAVEAPPAALTREAEQGAVR